MKEGVLVLKIQPGAYTVMVHDPRMLPIRYRSLEKKLLLVISKSNQKFVLMIVSFKIMPSK
jgi:hypothetical protein